MKKSFSVMLAFLLIFGCMSITSFADNTSATVYVSIANKGKLVVAQEEVTVTDIDGDNALTVNDALYAVHSIAFPGGAKEGYSYYTHKDYGLSLGKLWGDTSGNFGYYINNKSCWSLADSVKTGDYLNAFVYSDSKNYSDKYCFFSSYTVTADANSNIELTLSGAGYDANWNPVTLPVANAEITVDGTKTGIKTDANGNATIQISGAGKHIISAVSASETLVPPVCTAQINGGILASVLSAITSFFSAIINFIHSIFA
ncbi:MAG: hypothetical protein IKV76_03580 [Clostridia bacterium]|nr:hypothetical protein [Clostridia bacterium]